MGRVYEDGVEKITPSGDAVTSAIIADGSIMNADINASALIGATKIADGTVTDAEFQYLGDVTSAIQAQIDAIVSGKTFGKVVKSADESVTSSVTLQDDDDLTVALSANKNYHFFCIFYIISSTTPSIKYAWSIPSGTTNNRLATKWDGANATVNEAVDLAREVSIFDTNQHVFSVNGYVLTGGTSGNLTFQFAQKTSDAVAVTVKQGSILLVWEG